MPAVTSATNSFVSTALLIAVQVAVAVLLLVGRGSAPVRHAREGMRAGSSS